MRITDHLFIEMEEVVNTVTHAFGTIAAVIGCVVLFVTEKRTGLPSQQIAFGIFGLSLVAVYFTSTLFHALSFTRARQWLEILDHIVITLFAAGTYTPFVMLTFPHAQQIPLMAAIWSSALFGILFSVRYATRFWLSLGFHLLYGWAGVFLIRHLFVGGFPQTAALLCVGGLLYTVGAFFYSRESWKFNHGIWHLFVMGGSASHYLALLTLR